MKPTQKEEVEALMKRAAWEIESLRRDNDLKTARLEMFDAMMLLFKSQPMYKREGAEHPDVVYELKTFVFDDK